MAYWGLALASEVLELSLTFVFLAFHLLGQTLVNLSRLKMLKRALCFTRPAKQGSFVKADVLERTESLSCLSLETGIHQGADTSVNKLVTSFVPRNVTTHYLVLKQGLSVLQWCVV